MGLTLRPGMYTGEIKMSEKEKMEILSKDTPHLCRSCGWFGPFYYVKLENNELCCPVCKSTDVVKDPSMSDILNKFEKKETRYFMPISAEGLAEKILQHPEIKEEEEEDLQYRCKSQQEREEYLKKPATKRVSPSHNLLTISPRDMTVNFDCENVSLEPFYKMTSYRGKFHTLESGLTFLGVFAGGDWEFPVFFIIYWDGTILRAYIPSEGNPYNKQTKCAFGNDDSDEEELKKLGVDNQDCCRYNFEEMLKDINKNFKKVSDVNDTVEPSTVTMTLTFKKACSCKFLREESKEIGFISRNDLGIPSCFKCGVTWKKL
ncbi:MAG: hypothetical protein WC511_01700 [Candidatus Pacearchaeota archaeon]